MKIILAAAAIEVLLVVVEGLNPKLGFLPLGGSSVAQLGVLLGLALFATEMASLVGG